MIGLLECYEKAGDLDRAAVGPCGLQDPAAAFAATATGVAGAAWPAPSMITG
jgi:hypothetical protein